MFVPALISRLADAEGASNRPNILVIMADDMGYSDIGCYGGEISTPNLDSLAAGGMRFTQFYNCAKCSPTRASLLTGQYDQAVGVKNMEHGSTFAEVLRAAGYRTIASGKWHQDPLPTTRGFDRYFGLADGCCNYWNPGTRARPGEGKPGRKRPTPRRWAIEDKAIMGYVPEDKDFYTTDAFTDYAVERLDGDNIRIAQRVNVGFAVSAPQGLVVPVVKDAGKKTLAEIAREETSLTDKARDNRLTLEDIEGETIALSNLGAYGIDSFLGIVPPPTSTILAVGNVVPTAMYRGENDKIAVRKMVGLSLAADHRVINGNYAAQFLAFIAEQLQNPQQLL